MSAKWQKVRLGDVGRVVTGSTPPTKHSEYFDGDYLFVTPSDLEYDSRNILRSERTISQQGFEKFRSRFVPVGAVMYTCIASIGKMGVATSNVLTNQQINSIVPSDEVDGCFLYYLLRNETPRIQGVNAGCAVPIINKSDFEAIEVAVPPLPVQKKIASILSAYDDLIENNRRRIAILEEMARKVYRKHFGGKKANGTVADVCEEIRRSVKPGEIDSETPYIGLEHMPRRSISLCEWESAEKVTSTKHDFKEGEILFGKIRPYFHKVGLAFVDGVASSDAIVIRPLRPELRNYVLLTVSSDDFVAAASQGMKEGSKMPRADWNLLLKYSIAIPEKDDLNRFNEVIEPMIGQLKTLCFANHKLAAARDALLPKLMDGKQMS